ncbi:MAG: undecaprenyl-diphosphate phosphatase [Alphaproteobacteria bacterium]|nr:undecaprenyl-diphosphate phosphatase [Alphaproteobacteria bacterium]
MSLLEIILLAVVQGITEFLPISSSGHLRVAAEILGLPGSTLAIDVAVHVGTLGAVLIYFWRDVIRVLVGVAQFATGRRTDGGLLGIYIVVATIPVFVVGFFGRDLIDGELRTLEIIGWTSIIFGLFLWWADRTGMTVLNLEHLTARNAIIIGLAQILALVPGTSRAGVTITAARLLGYERSEAARFSMLLSMPAVAGAGLLIALELVASGDAALGRGAVIAGILAFITALGAIALLMRWLQFSGFAPFVIYRVLMGAGILYWVYAV